MAYNSIDIIVLDLQAHYTTLIDCHNGIIPPHYLKVSMTTTIFV